MSASPPKPMLASECADELSKIKFPVYVQPKLDGIRAILKDGKLWSRTGKPIPNLDLQKLHREIAWLPHVTFDGELMVGDPTASDVWNKTSTVVMSKDKQAKDVVFHVFDLWQGGVDGTDYSSRRALLDTMFQHMSEKPLERGVKVVPSTLVKNEAELLMAEEYYTSQGYEGVILRSPNGAYKNGRATVRGGELLKLKRFKDAEAVVLEYSALEHNANPAEKDEFGRTKRSTAKAGLVPTEALGKFLVKDIDTGTTFEVGTGFTQAEREELWGVGLAGEPARIKHRLNLVGNVMTYKYQKLSPDGKPIFAVFKGWRKDI